MSRFIPPAATVVVPTKERPKALRRCLEALSLLEYPHQSLEVLIVDDADPDRRGELAALIDVFEDQLPLRLIAGAARGPAAARNTGIRAAGGEVVAFTDDDCAPEPGWLIALARAIGGEERLAGGFTANGLPNNRYSTASQAINDAVYAYYNRDPDNALFVASNNLAGHTGAFERLGGFDERFALAAGEDRDLCTRWLEAGGNIAYEPSAVVHHFHELGAGSFIRQHYGYGRGTHLQRRLLAQRGSGLKLAPAATSGILETAARVAVSEGARSRLPLLALWQLSNAAGFARGAITREHRR